MARKTNKGGTTQEMQWTKRPDGRWSLIGKIESRRVHILCLRDGVWSQPLAPFYRGDAEKIIVGAIEAGKTGKTEAYKLIEAADTEKMSVETKMRLRELGERKKKERANG